MQRAVEKHEAVAHSNPVNLTVGDPKQAGAVNLLLESLGLNGGQEADGRTLLRVRAANLKSLVTDPSIGKLSSQSNPYDGMSDTNLSRGYRITANDGSVHALMLPTRAPDVWLQLTGNKITSPVPGDHDLTLAFVIAVAPKSPQDK